MTHVLMHSTGCLKHTAREALDIEDTTPLISQSKITENYSGRYKIQVGPKTEGRMDIGLESQNKHR